MARLSTIPLRRARFRKKPGRKYWNRLFHQKSDGTFEDVTEKAGLQGVGYGMGVAVGDYDNDGYEDLYVTAYGGNRLYHNNGNGTFTDVTAEAGVGRRRMVHQRGVGGSGQRRPAGPGGPAISFSGTSTTSGAASTKRVFAPIAIPIRLRRLRRWCITTMATAASRRSRRKSAWPCRARASASLSRITTVTVTSIFSWPTIPCPNSCSTTRETAPSRRRACPRR